MSLSTVACTEVEAICRLPSVRVFETRDGARGKCHAASVAVAMWLRVRGIENRIIRFLGPRPGLRRYLEPYELEVVDEIAQHAVYVEESAVVDFTWRMWSGDHPFPRVSPLEEYLVDFATMDETICGVCGAYRLFDGQTPPCHHLAPALEREVVAGLQVLACP